MQIDIEEVAKELAAAIPGSLGGVYGGRVSKDQDGIEKFTEILLKFAEAVKREAVAEVFEKLKPYGIPW